MRVLSSIADVRTRALANVLDLVGNGDGEWSRLLADLGPVGRDARPVVIQGGLSTDAYLYEPLKRLLVERGFDVHVTGMPLHGFASIHNDAHALARTVDAASRAAVARGGDGLVQLLAHSKGGLTSRWYLQRMGGIDNVAQLVTVGTPHNGMMQLGPVATNLLARMPGIAALRQLAATGAEVTSLNAALPEFMSHARQARPEFRITSLAGDLDLPGLRGTDLLVSTRSAALDEAIQGTRNLVFRGGGAHHGAIVGQYGMHEPTLRAVVELLAGRAVADVARGVTAIS